MLKKLTTLSLIVLSLSSFAQIPTNGLVAWWPFTGNAVDSVNQYNNGTVYGATLTTDRHGNSNSAYYFDGNGDYIDVGTHSSIRGGTHTLSFWFKYSKTSSTMQIVSNFNSYNGEWGSAALANASTGLQYNAGSGGSGKNMLHQSFTRLADNQWHLFTAMFDDSRNILSVYFDDDLSGGVNYVAGGHFSASDSLYFKANEHWIFGAASMYFSTSKNNGPQYYEGSLDDVRMYDRVLTTTEVLKIYHEGSFNVDSTVYDTVEYAVFDTTFITHYDTAQVWDTIYSTVYDTSRSYQ